MGPVPRLYRDNAIMALSMQLLPVSLYYKGLLLCVMFDAALIDVLLMVYCCLCCYPAFCMVSCGGSGGRFSSNSSGELDEMGGLPLATCCKTSGGRPVILSLGT